MSTVIYNLQLGSDLGDRSTFDQTVPYNVVCNYRSFNSDVLNQKFCVIEAPGMYALDSAETKLVLAKNVSVSLSDCWVDLEVPSDATGGYTSFGINMYIGTYDDVITSDTVLLYRFWPYIIAGNKMKIKIPDITAFNVPAGKNVVFSVYSGGASYVNAHFVVCVDD